MARREPEVKDLLDRFVCVRVIQANALDLAAFQFDFGLTWAILFMNPDKTVYGRYGSRSRAEGSEDVSVEGFRKAAEAAIELHRGYPANKASLAGKSGPAPRHPTPRGYPPLREYPPAVVPERGERNNPTCLHCHQIQGAEYGIFREAGKPIPDGVLWTWPMPDALGISLDVKERATVKSVAAGSPGAKAGFKAGDEILRLEGQPVISIADVQWVLERAKDGDSLRAEVRRGDQTETITLALPPGWRRSGDFSWRDATWGAFRPDMNGVAEGGGIRITYAGPGIASAGFQKDDLIAEVDGRRFATFSLLLAYVAQERRPGEKMSVTVLRSRAEKKLEMVAP